MADHFNDAAAATLLAQSALSGPLPEHLSPEAALDILAREFSSLPSIVRGGELLVAASDSPVQFKVRADYLCDGVADQTEIQAALDALAPFGGRVSCAPGTYNFSAGVVVTDPDQYTLTGYGARVVLGANNLVAFTIQQHSTSVNYGVTVEGFLIDGASRSGGIAVAFVDTNWSTLRNVRILNCPTCILMHAKDANQFVEGICLDNVVGRGWTVAGIEYRRTGGTNSFGQHHYRNVGFSSGSGTGVILPTGCSIYRSTMEIGVWVGSNQVAFDFDGDFDSAELHLFVEGSTGSTGNTGVKVGTNASLLDTSDNFWSFWGTIATQIDNSFSKNFAYTRGRRYTGVTNAAPLQVFKHGTSGAYASLGFGGVGGGRLDLGSAGTLDVNVYRNAADVLKSDDRIEAADSMTVKVIAGAPTDGAFLHTPPDGTVALDSTNSRWYVRVGGTWKFVALA